jgi:hypothetical protein
MSWATPITLRMSQRRSRALLMEALVMLAKLGTVTVKGSHQILVIYGAG